MAKNWIQGMNMKKGALRRSLGVKKGKDIPEEELEEASKKPGKMGKRAKLAMTLKKLAAKKRDED